MPVLRKRERIRENFSPSGPVNTGRVAMVQTAELGAQMAGKAAHDFSKLMASEAVEKGKALAKAATFATGAGGLPEMPPDATAEMGRLARNSYDATIQERYAHQMTTAIRAQMRDAENANMFDYDAFAADAERRLQGMAADVPDGMEGMFQQISTGLMADAGASIGSRNAQVQLGNRRSQEPVMGRDARLTMRDAILAKNPDGARDVMAMELARIDAVPAHILDDAGKADARDKLYYDFGWYQLLSAEDLENKSYSELQDLQERMATGEDEELAKYFTDPQGQVRYDLMKKAMYEINPFLGKAQQRETQQNKAITQNAQLDLVLRGGGSANGSASERSLLTRYLSDAIGFEQDKNPGHARPMDMSDWLTMDDKTRADALAVLKTAGFPDATLSSELRRLDRVQDPQELAAAFPLLRDVLESPNSAGQVISFEEYMPERLQAIYQQASILHGDGDPSQESIGKAIQQVDLLRDAEWNDELLARKLNADNSWLDGRGKVGADTARDEMRRAVIGTVFEDIQARPDEKDQAVSLFETYYRLGHTLDEAMEMTSQSFDGRYTESKFMAGASRSAYAPEKQYSDPGVSTLSELFSRTSQKAGGRALKGLENIAFFGIKAAQLFGVDVQLGSDALSASPFERLADAKIKQMVEADPVLGPMYESQKQGVPFWRGGEDYVLTPDMGAGIPPVYHVQVRGPSGTWQRLGTLDVRKEWDALTRLSVSATALERSQFQRGQDFLMEGGKAAEEAWGQIFQDAIDGKDTDFKKLFENLPEADTQTGPKL